MPKITDELCDRIWAVYQRTLNYAETAREMSHDPRTVKKCVEKKKAELERSRLSSIAREAEEREDVLAILQ